MPYLLAGIANSLFVAGLGLAKFFARYFTINTAIILGLTALSSVAVASLITTLKGYIQPYLDAISSLPVVPFLLPSNIGPAFTIIIGTKLSVTGYVMYMRWVTNRAYILKA